MAIYPFKNLVSLHAHGSVDKRAKSILNTLELHRNNLEEGLKDLDRELASTAAARAGSYLPGFGGGSELYGLAKPFFDDIAALRRDKTHLYHAFA